MPPAWFVNDEHTGACREMPMRFVCFVLILAAVAACATASEHTAIGAGGDAVGSASKSGAVSKSLDEQAAEIRAVAKVWRTCSLRQSKVFGPPSGVDAYRAA
jgi:hypothetical protein